MFKRWEQWKARWFARQYSEHRQLIEKVREIFVNHLLSKEPDLIDAYGKQSHILARDNRTIIAIFVREDVYRTILEKCIKPKEGVAGIFTTMKATNEPIGFFGEIPIYLSSLMTQAPLFVSGEIIWKLRNE